MDKRALITGASSGIGAALAGQLAAQGYTLFLTGRNPAALEQVAGTLHCRCLALDLAREADLAILEEEMRAFGPDVLINNAGLGQLGDLLTMDPARAEEIVRVNCLALTRLLQTGLRGMQDRERAYILNVASVAGLLPAGPHMAVYYASKAYVTSLTLAARQEMRERRSGISISALCPGPVNTRFNERAGVSRPLKGLEAETVARVALRGLFRGKALIVPGMAVRASVFLWRLLPRELYAGLISRQQAKKGIKEGDR